MGREFGYLAFRVRTGEVVIRLSIADLRQDVAAAAAVKARTRRRHGVALPTLCRAEEVAAAAIDTNRYPLLNRWIIASVARSADSESPILIEGRRCILRDHPRAIQTDRRRARIGSLLSPQHLRARPRSRQEHHRREVRVLRRNWSRGRVRRGV